MALQRVFLVLILMIGLASPAVLRAQTASAPAIREILSLADTLENRIAALDQRYGTSSSGMFQRVDEALAAAGVEWARKTYTDVWANDLSYSWKLGTPNVVGYLRSHVKALRETARRLEEAGTAGDDALAYFQSGIQRLDRRIAAIEAIFTSCVFPNLVRAGVARDRAKRASDAYYAMGAEGWLADPARARALGEENLSQWTLSEQILIEAEACKTRELLPMISTPVFRALAADGATPVPATAEAVEAGEDDGLPGVPGPAGARQAACERSLRVARARLENTEREIGEYQDLLEDERARAERLQAEIDGIERRLNALEERLKELGTAESPETLTLYLREIPQRAVRREIVARVIDVIGGWIDGFEVATLPPGLSGRAVAAIRRAAQDKLSRIHETEVKIQLAREERDRLQGKLSRLVTQFSADLKRLTRLEGSLLRLRAAVRKAETCADAGASVQPEGDFGGFPGADPGGDFGELPEYDLNFGGGNPGPVIDLPLGEPDPEDLEAPIPQSQ